MHYLLLPLSTSAKAMPSTLRDSEFNKRQYGRWRLKEVAVVVMHHKSQLLWLVFYPNECTCDLYLRNSPTIFTSEESLSLLSQLMCTFFFFFFIKRGKNRKWLKGLILISAGPTHSLCHSGCLWVWLCEFPRAAIPNSDNVSRGGGGAGQRVPLDHYVQGPSRGLHVGECILNMFNHLLSFTISLHQSFSHMTGKVQNTPWFTYKNRNDTKCKC